MAEISLTINNRSYDVTCDDGQEEHLRKLAEHIDDRVRELSGSLGAVGEARLLVLASLLISDELFEAYKELHEFKSGLGPKGDTAAAALEAGAVRVEAIAARLAEA